MEPSETSSQGSTTEIRSKWLGQPKEEIAYLCQVILLYIVIITCIINLSIENGYSNLWTALLSSSLGYMLPSPSFKKKKHKSKEIHSYLDRITDTYLSSVYRNPAHKASFSGVDKLYRAVKDRGIRGRWKGGCNVKTTIRYTDAWNVIFTDTEW